MHYLATYPPNSWNTSSLCCHHRSWEDSWSSCRKDSYSIWESDWNCVGVEGGGEDSGEREDCWGGGGEENTLLGYKRGRSSNISWSYWISKSGYSWD